MRDHTSTSRRTVLQTAAMAVPLAAVRGTAANSAPSVGLIGCGGRGGSLAGALLQATDARLVAMCDLFDEQIAKTKERIGTQSPKEYNDLNELLATDVDAVIIATPPFVHAGHFEAAVKAGQAHLYREARSRERGGLQAHHAGVRLGGPQGQHHHGLQRRYAKVYKKAKRRMIRA